MTHEYIIFAEGIAFGIGLTLIAASIHRWIFKKKGNLMKLILLSLVLSLLSWNCSTTKETVNTHIEADTTRIESPNVIIDSVAGVKDNTYQPPEKKEPPQKEPDNLLPPDTPKPIEEISIKEYEIQKFKYSWKGDSLAFTADTYIETEKGVEIKNIWLKNVKPKFKFVIKAENKTTIDSKKETTKKSFTDSFKDFWNTLLPFWKIIFLVLALAFLALSVKGMLSFWKK